MSTAKDNVTSGVIDMGDGAKAVPNGDGSYTVTGAGEDNGVYYPAGPDTPGAFQITDVEKPQYGFLEGTWWVKQ